MDRPLTLLFESSRRVAVLVAARVTPGLDVATAAHRFDRLPRGVQRLVALAVPAWLLAAALVAAQFGALGLGVYLAAVVVLAR